MQTYSMIVRYYYVLVFVTELCVLRTFGGVDFSLTFICAQSVSDFLWDRLRASIKFPVMPKRAQYARFSGERNRCEFDPNNCGINECKKLTVVLTNLQVLR